MEDAMNRFQTRAIATAIAIIAGASAAHAQSVHSLADSGTMQTRISNQWNQSHPTLARDNQHVAVAAGDRTSGASLSCDFSQGAGRRIQVSNCRR
jgi:hypothetical protein